MMDMQGNGEDSNLLSKLLKIALAVAALGYLVAQSSLSERLDYKGLSRLAADVAKKFPDPAFTGSVEKSARATKLDPCVAPKKS